MSALQRASARAAGAGLRRLADELDFMRRVYTLPITRSTTLRLAAAELRDEANRREHEAANTAPIGEPLAVELA